MLRSLISVSPLLLSVVAKPTATEVAETYAAAVAKTKALAAEADVLNRLGDKDTTEMLLLKGQLNRAEAAETRARHNLLVAISECQDPDERLMLCNFQAGLEAVAA